MQQDAVAGALWPEAEGDAARQALRTTVHRLRRLLGSAEAVLQGEARVALDAGRVYVDLWAWGWRLDRLESRRTSAEEQARIRERLRDRFGAGVPAGDEEDPLLGEARRHLRGRVRRCLARPSPDVR
jgi:DNA-binding SARP family transcriptional activator